jgi:DNA-binding transcriptional ArsR family regulator
MLQTLTALAEPNRFRIVELLRTGARPVGDIGDRLRLQQPQVSKHLRVLRDAGIVEVRARAQQRLYELRAEPLRELNAWLERFRDIWDERYRRLDDLLTEMQEAEKTTPRKRRKK